MRPSWTDYSFWEGGVNGWIFQLTRRPSLRTVTVERRSSGGKREALVHELAITESIVAAVVERLGDRRVERVTLVIGRLAGVVADSVEFCFELCARGTSLEGAKLDIIDVEGRGRCRDCGREFLVVDHVLLCPCGSADVAIIGGEELLIRQVEVAA
ncbi:MAG: hypothetical protein NVS3B21_17070 [Acidimicrobiales bacterium]